MKFEIPLPCQKCGSRDPVKVPLMAAWWEWTCRSCGHNNAILSAVSWTLGWRILEKAKTEYIAGGDCSTSIVFSAMAFEAELARLYFKWRGIDTMRIEMRRPTEEELDDEYRQLGRAIANKIEKVGRLLDDRGIDEFARRSDLAERIGSDFPSLNIGSLAKDIQESVFWPRNRILHAGFLDYEAEDARRVHNIASMGLELLKQMDLARRL